MERSKSCSKKSLEGLRRFFDLILFCRKRSQQSIHLSPSVLFERVYKYTTKIGNYRERAANKPQEGSRITYIRQKLEQFGEGCTIRTVRETKRLNLCSHRGRQSSPKSTSVFEASTSPVHERLLKGVEDMNRHLDAAMLYAAKVDAMMDAIDELYMEEAPDQLQYMHMTVCELVKNLREELDKLSEDKRVVDAIYALNDVRRNTD